MPSNRGTRTTNSASEMLKSLLQDIAIAQTLPDGDLEFLGNLQQIIIAKLREPAQQMLMQQGIAPAGPPLGPGGGMGGGMGAMPTFPAPPGGGVAGLRNGGSLPPVDELRRMIGAAAR